MLTTTLAGEPFNLMTVVKDDMIVNETHSQGEQDTLNAHSKTVQKQKGKQKQMSIEFFASPMRKKHRADNELSHTKVLKRPKLETSHEKNGSSSIASEVIEIEIGGKDQKTHGENNNDDEDQEESEESIDQEIMDLATESDHEEIENVEAADAEKSQSELRKLKREQEREQKQLQKQIEEEKKRILKQQKKEEEAERRRLKKEKEEEERRSKREKIEAEREAKRQQKEREKEEKQKKREEEAKLKEEKRKREEEEKTKKKEELERKRHEKILEKQKLEEEKEQKKLEEEEKIKKRSITNFFKVKPTLSDGNVESTANSLTTSQTTGILAAAQVQKVNTEESEKSEFQQYFLPFYVKPNAKLAETIKKEISSKWDEFLKSPSSFIDEPRKVSKEKPIFEGKTERAFDVLKCLNAGSMNEANRLFREVPLRYIKFYEKKQPPYFGTFSYTMSDVEEPGLDLRLQPWSKITLKRSGGAVDIEEAPAGEEAVINYEYDSELEGENAEGEDDEDGEDLDSADEEDDDDDEAGSSDIDEFVEKDSAEVTSGERESEGSGGQMKKRRVIGPLVPALRHCQDEIADGDEFGEYFTTLRWERMNSDIDFPIDPFKNYWKKQGSTKTEKEENVPSTSMQGKTLTSALMSGAKDSEASATSSKAAAAAAATGSTVPLGVKKKVITNAEHVRILLAFVDSHKTLSLNTLAELAVKDGASQGVLGDYSRAVVKNTVKANASFDKKTGWQVLADGAVDT